jgi:hypothetical protein
MKGWMRWAILYMGALALADYGYMLCALLSICITSRFIICIEPYHAILYSETAAHILAIPLALSICRNVRIVRS